MSRGPYPLPTTFGATAVSLLAATFTGCSSSGITEGSGGTTGALTVGAGAGTGPSGGGASPTGSATGSGGATTTGSVTGVTGSVAPTGMAGTTGVTGAAGAPGAGGSVSSAGSSSAGMTAAGGAMLQGGASGATGIGGSGGTGGTGGAGGVGGAGVNGGSGGAPVTCPQVTPLTSGNEYCSNVRGNVGNGYAYELWADGGGTGCITVHGQEAAFSAEWGDVEDFLGRVGLDFDETQKHAQIGTFTAEFAETKMETGGDGLTYIGIYGWTVDPLREFYILDDWGMTKPGGFSSDGTPRDEVGTLVADGETYDVWKKTRENKPSIKGDATFDQYFSIRRTARQCGTISVSEHFNQWEGLGLELGNLYEVKWLVEAQFNSGNVQFTTATVEVTR